MSQLHSLIISTFALEQAKTGLDFNAQLTLISFFPAVKSSETYDLQLSIYWKLLEIIIPFWELIFTSKMILKPVISSKYVISSF